MSPRRCKSMKFTWKEKHFTLLQTVNALHTQLYIVMFFSASLAALPTHPIGEIQVTDGTWGEWTEWAPCSASCGGGGVRSRARICQAASPYGQQLCTRPGKVSTASEACALTDCSPDFLGVVPLGCWIIQPEAAPISHTNQIPGQCTSYCQGEGFSYGAMDQTITGLSSQKGTCYCMNNYTQFGRSNRCNTICQDQVEGGALHVGYLCGFSGGQMLANVYAVRENERGTWGPWSDWSPCDCKTEERYRNRTCHVSRSNRENCEGKHDEVERCKAPEVGDWTTWTSWTSCSLTCGGGGLQTRTRVCQGPCGSGIMQLCPFAGQVDTEEVQCGMAPCITPDSSAFSEPVSPLGCYNIGEYTENYPTGGVDNNPGFCLRACYPDGQSGYVAVDMSSPQGPDWGFCACLKGDDYYSEGARTECSKTCGGENQLFPGYLCGTGTPFIGNIYGKRTASSTIGHWSAWSSCSCPRGQTRTRACQLSPTSFAECNPPTFPAIEVRECQPDPCVQCDTIPPLENGVIGGDSINGFGAVKLFECNRRFSLVGPTLIRCTYGGFWGAEPPICQDQNCPTLEPIKNGNISTVPGSEGDLIIFTCYEGYSLIGSSVLFCDEKGKWNSTQPLCIAPPQLLSPRTTVEIDRNLGTFVNITCTFAGSLPLRVLWWAPPVNSPLTGSQDQFLITTERDGETSDGLPVVISTIETDNITSDVFGEFICATDNDAGLISGKAILNALCPGLPPVQNGTTSVIPDTSGRLMQVKCNDGFSLIGSSALYCGRDGKWNSSLPTCQAPPVLRNENKTTVVDCEIFSPVSFSCRFSASLPVSMLWWTPTLSTPISDSQPPYVMEIITLPPTEGGLPQTMSRLLIDNVTASMDGLFVCAADNAAGVSSGKVVLNVFIPTSPPVIPGRQLSVGERYGQYIAIGLGLLAGVLLLLVIYGGWKWRTHRKGCTRFD